MAIDADSAASSTALAMLQAIEGAALPRVVLTRRAVVAGRHRRRWHGGILTYDDEVIASSAGTHDTARSLPRPIVAAFGPAELAGIVQFCNQASRADVCAAVVRLVAQLRDDEVTLPGFPPRRACPGHPGSASRIFMPR